MIAGTNEGGRDYDALTDSIDRLHGTNFRTNVLSEGIRADEWFGIIDGARTKKDEVTGKILSIQLKFSEMVRHSIRQRDVLTLHPHYFRLRRPVDRRVYELGRKHCGQKPSWACFVKTIWEKSGSKSSLREFRRMLKPAVANEEFPDYSLFLDAEKDKLHFFNKNTMPRDEDIKAARDRKAAKNILDRLSPDINDKAREIAQGWDMHYVQQCFAAWWVKIGQPDTENADGFFLTFCRTWQAKKGRP